MTQSLAEVPPISCRRTNVASSSPMSFCTDVTGIVFVVYVVRTEPSLCWERRNMDPGLNPSGRLAGPVIRTCTRHFWRSPREP